MTERNGRQQGAAGKEDSGQPDTGAAASLMGQGLQITRWCR